MFGKNIIMKQMDAPSVSYKVREVFSTIQGEGPHAGLPATFIRLGGCNLRCHFCDTDFDYEKSVSMTHMDLGLKCKDLDNDLIVITGGEPLLQRIEPLCLFLLNQGFKVQVETAGTVEFRWEMLVDWNDDWFTMVVSPKTANLHASMDLATAFKYLIQEGQTDPEDGLPVCNTQTLNGKPKPLARPPARLPPTKVFLQPMDESHVSPDRTKLNTDEAVRLCREHGYRLSLQLHKILELP